MSADKATTTPLTDAATFQGKVPAHFARTLEQELNEAKTERSRYAEMADNAQNFSIKTSMQTMALNADRWILIKLLEDLIVSPSIYESLPQSTVGCVFCGSVNDASADDHWHEPACIVTRATEAVAVSPSLSFDNATDWQPIKHAPIDRPVGLWFPAIGGWPAGEWIGSWSEKSETWAIHVPHAIHHGQGMVITDLPAPSHFRHLTTPPTA